MVAFMDWTRDHYVGQRQYNTTLAKGVPKLKKVVKAELLQETPERIGPKNLQPCFCGVLGKNSHFLKSP